MGLYISGNSLGGMTGRIVSGSIAYHFPGRRSFGSLVFQISWLVFYCLYCCQNPKLHGPSLFPGRGVTDMMAHLKNKTLRCSYLVGFFLMFSFVGVYNYVGFLLAAPPYLLSTKALGLIFLTYLAGTISSTLSGAAASRLGNPLTIGVSVIISILGLLLTFSDDIFIFIIGLTLFCFGFFAGHSAASSWVSINAKGARCGASGLYLIAYYLGGGLGGTMLGPYG
ncbi:hypothetical protein N752_21840 [Desulforamulus aquiferis]|nr:MFS transporter [Desulforamulus aquiferis]RYD03056.1 hypothetical protein N752_21840 [Desulforamulus aquiferis]